MIWKWHLYIAVYLLCLTAAIRSGPENMEKRLSPLAEEVSSLELAESPWAPDQLFVTSLWEENKKLVFISGIHSTNS